MKAIAASNIAQYERAVESIHRYTQAVELGLAACLRNSTFSNGGGEPPKGRALALVIGPDYGMVGQFNEHLVEYLAQPRGLCPRGTTIWAIGERIESPLQDAGYGLDRRFPPPEFPKWGHSNYRTNHPGEL
jgi:F-type H+-transporting ATPase subunit gamma